MTPAPAGAAPRALLLDIEGTMTPIAFVRDVLFPYARARLAEHFRATWNTSATRGARRELAAEQAADRTAGEAPPLWTDDPESAAAYAAWLMDRDRKSPGLKRIQGDIWDRAYQAGELQGEVFDDVPRALRRWRAEGRRTAIYSSGSELAQRRLFESTRHGDLTPLIDVFFDTAVGAKGDAASYARIATGLGLAASDILFVSDVASELAAARSAGLDVVLSVRPGNAPVPAGDYPRVETFDAIVQSIAPQSD